MDLSELQTDLDLTSSPLLKLQDMQAVDSGILSLRTGRKAYVMIMTFETQTIIKDLVPTETRTDGFINPGELPEDEIDYGVNL